ncbi:MAG: sugar ABC transporter permease [Proteobacteria bacterium]|nr:sugar ABC transporter permease [Pseudomonadota bacterium]
MSSPVLEPVAGGGTVAAAATAARRGFFARRRSREWLFIALLLAPALLIYLAYRVVPLLWNVVLSFSYWAPGKAIAFAGLTHYEEMLFQDETFWVALKNTGLFMLATPLSIALALGLALLVDQKVVGKGLYRSIIFLPYPMMVVAVGIVWRWLYNDRGGLVNYALQSMGLISRPIAFLESTQFALAAVMVAAVWQMLGLFVVILLTGLQNIPSHLYEAARIDGALAIHRFWRITLPLLRPSLFLCVILGIIASFTSFDLIYSMTGGGPGRATELLVTYIYKQAFTLTRFDYAAAMTAVMFALFLAIALLANRLSGGDAGKVDIAE